MKLYYAPGACSMSPHIVLEEGGFSYEPVKVNLREHKTEGGADYYAINPKGYVPALELDNGELLTEGPAIVQYLADQRPQANLAPANGTIERARLQEWLNFIGTEIHKQFGPLFNPATPDDAKTAAKARIGGRFDIIDRHLAGGRDYLMGSTFSVADAYLFTMLQWANRMQIDMAGRPKLVAFRERMLARPKVHATLQAEGLL